MMGDAEMRSMDRHHAQMVREMRDIAPEMARMMDRLCSAGCCRHGRDAVSTTVPKR
jgi:hypothetical protein